ncbi:hypothetical protein D3C78_499160 [compost metagenome]
MAAQVQTLQLVCLSFSQGFVWRARQQPRQLIAADLLRQGQGAEFFLQVHRLAEGIQAEDQRRILGLPVFRAVAAAGEVGRQFVAVAEQVGIDPAGVDFEEALEPGRSIGVQLGGVVLEVGSAHQAVDVQRLASGQFRQAALGQQAHGEHLPDTVAGVDVAEAEQCIMEAAAFDQRCAHGVAAHRNILRQAFERLHAGGRWHTVLIAAHLATGKPEHAEQRGSGGEPWAEGRKDGGGHDKGSCKAWRGSNGAKVVSAQAPCKVR